MIAGSFTRFALAALTGQALGCGAHDRAPVPTPPTPTRAVPSIAAEAPLQGELDVFAEGPRGMTAYTLTNALVIDRALGPQPLSWHVVSGVHVATAPVPDATELGTQGVTAFGRWPDGVWLVQTFVGGGSGPENVAGSRAFALRDGKWKKVIENEDHRILDVWESPHGCWLGIVGDAWFGGSAKTLERTPLSCTPSPQPFFISKPSHELIAVRGLPDGGIVALDWSAERFFGPEAIKSPPSIVRWDRAGKESQSTLPPPTQALSAGWLLLSSKILRESHGTLVLIGNLVATAVPEPGRISLVYGARCDASSCAPIALPPLVRVRQAETTEDGAILLSGEEKNEFSWTVWALPPGGEWRRIGRPPRRFEATVPIALYGRSAEDVWVGAESTAKPSQSVLLRSQSNAMHAQ